MQTVVTYAFIPQQNGTIARFVLNPRTGALTHLMGDTETFIRHPLDLIASPDKRFLYAYPTYDEEKDGCNWEFCTPDDEKAVRTKPTPLVVFAVEPDGNLRRVQRQLLPGPLGFLLPHPGGRFVLGLTYGQNAGGLLFKIGGTPQAKAGALYLKARLPIVSGMYEQYGFGILSSWHLAFSPSGDYLYDHYLRGFSENSHGVSQRYRVNQDGTIKGDGEEQRESRSRNTESGLWGGIWAWKNQTAFLEERGTFMVCRTDETGRTLQKTQVLKLLTRGTHEWTPVLASPRLLPFVVYRLSFPDPYRIWQITAPGQGQTVGTFASAFGGGEQTGQQHLFAEPGGRFLYEINAPWKKEAGLSVAVFVVRENGVSVKLFVKPLLLPTGSGSGLIFV